MIGICPLPASLTDIPVSNCPFQFDQILRMAFQRRQPTATPPFATLTALQTLATWTGFKDADDDTKIVVSPIFSGLVIPASEAITTGGNDNNTPFGIRKYTGEGTITVTGRFTNMPPVIKRALDLLSMESKPGGTGISNLTAYFFNKYGNSFQVNPVDGAGAATTTYKGVPIYNFRVSSPGSEGLNADNINTFSFDLQPEWADYLTAVKPNFDPLTEI